MLQNRKGFTLIELLIVVVIIGILAAIAIPKFSATREKAYFSAMKSDLKNLQTQQEIYYSSVAGNYNYASSLTDLEFSASSGVTINIDAANQTGWRATASHAALASNQKCYVYVGSEATSAGVTAGLVTCTNEN